MLLREIEVEKYWYMPTSYGKERRELEIDKMINSGDYAFQLKTDGNYGALVCDFDGEKMLLGRGISKVSGTYTHYEDSVFERRSRQSGVSVYFLQIWSDPAPGR